MINFQTAGVRGGAVLGPVVSGSHPGDDPPHHPLSLHRPPLHPRQDDPPPGLRVAGRLGRPGDVQGLPEQVQEGGVQLEGPGPGQAAGGGGQQDGSQQRGNQHLVMRQDETISPQYSNFDIFIHKSMGSYNINILSQNIQQNSENNNNQFYVL